MNNNNQANEPKKKDPKIRTFVMKGKANGSVRVPVFDENGEQMKQTDYNGKTLVNKDGSPRLITKRIVFEPFISNVKVGTVSKRETSDPTEIKALEACVERGDSSVITLDKWKKGKNLAAWENEQKFLEEQQKRINLEKEFQAFKEKGGAGKALDAKDSEIQKLKNELEKVKKD